MKYLKLFEEYKDKIGHGSCNVVTEIDKDWVLKEPKTMNFTHDYSVRNMKEILKKFQDDIKLMISHPDIFAKTKLLSKNRAAVEKVNIKQVKCETEYIYNTIKQNLNEYVYEYVYESEMLLFLYNNNDYLELLNNDDEVCERWYNFIKKLQKYYYLWDDIDLYPRNIGIDKEGNIKLIDF